MPEVEILLFRQSVDMLALEVYEPLNVGAPGAPLFVSVRRFGFGTDFLSDSGWVSHTARISVREWNTTSMGLLLLVPTFIATYVQEDMLVEISILNQHGDVLGHAKVLAPDLGGDMGGQSHGAAASMPATVSQDLETDLPMRMTLEEKPAPSPGLITDAVTADFTTVRAPVQPEGFTTVKPPRGPLAAIGFDKHPRAVMAAAAVFVLLLGGAVYITAFTGNSIDSIEANSDTPVRLKTREDVAAYIAKSPGAGGAAASADAALKNGYGEIAFLAYRYAADKGDATAALHLARMYNPERADKSTASIVKPNADVAATWYRKAVDAHNSDAAYELGTLMIKGAAELPADKATGAKLVRMAAEAGHAGAKEMLPTLETGGEE